MKPCTCIHYFCYALWGRRMTLHWPELSIVISVFIPQLLVPHLNVSLYPQQNSQLVLSIKAKNDSEMFWWMSPNGLVTGTAVKEFSWTNQFISTNQFERVLWKYVSCMHPYELNHMLYVITRLPSWFPPIKTSLGVLRTMQCYLPTLHDNCVVSITLSQF